MPYKNVETEIREAYFTYAQQNRIVGRLQKTLRLHELKKEKKI